LQIGAHGSVGNQNVPLRHFFFETLHMNFFFHPLEQAMDSRFHGNDDQYLLMILYFSIVLSLTHWRRFQVSGAWGWVCDPEVGFSNFVIWSAFPSVLSALGKSPKGRKSLAQGARRCEKIAL
jgi:hypothetical protein